ncbi:putative adipose-regulatory protein-domain-containing protein [Gloeopeniophorella convolvens]|nr:putative adipose-regulatory protein-domain-containing protein [Gloeopeniophorella convolvens]
MEGSLEKRRGRQQRPSLVSRVAYTVFLYPMELLFSLVTSALHPIAPQLIPLVVFFLLVPFLAIPAVISGVYVWNSRATSWDSPLFLQYGDGLPPYAEAQLSSFSPTQPYDISLHLVVPATPSNYALGNFMTILTLTGPSNRTLTTVRKPAIVLPPSAFRLSKPSTATLKVHLLSGYVSGASRIAARVELGRRDGWKSVGTGEGRELSVLMTSLEGRVRPQGIRGIVTRYPLLSGAVASVSFLVASFLVLAVCLVPALRWQYIEDNPAAAKADPGVRSRPSQDVLAEKRVRRRSLKRSGSAGRVKREDNETALPPADAASTPLRRRQSRPSEPVSDSD